MRPRRVEAPYLRAAEMVVRREHSIGNPSPPGHALTYGGERRLIEQVHLRGSSSSSLSRHSSMPTELAQAGLV